MASNPQLPPAHVQVLICGGGPGGSYAAAALAREGIDVAVLEMSTFPRYHVGESLIPSARHYLRFIDAEEKVANHGFIRKPGSAIKFNQFKKEGYTDFVALGHDNNAWNVIRSEFDEILLNHARESGARVFEQTRASRVDFEPVEGSSEKRPVAVSWVYTPPGVAIPEPSCSATSASWLGSATPSESILSAPPSPASFASFSTASSSPISPFQVTGRTTFSYLIDATGRNGLLTTKYHKYFGSRRMNTSLRNMAVWGYWKNTGRYVGPGPGAERSGAPWFEALTDETGWAWFIPLHDGTVSVGVVTDAEMWNKPMTSGNNPFIYTLPNDSPGCRSTSSSESSTSLTTRYLAALPLAPGLIKLIGGGNTSSSSNRGGGGTLGVDSTGILVSGSVKSARDFSYSSPQYGGPGWRMVGDAGAFIDPLFSSGIHLAMSSGLTAATSICAILRKDCSEKQAAKWYNARVGLTYTRFQIVVLSAYKQIRAQGQAVLLDVDEDNYDRAFAFLRPVIQGAGDMGVRLSESELQNSLDFCVNLFNPTSPEQHARVSKRFGDLLDVTAPALHPRVLNKVLVPVNLNIGAMKIGGKVSHFRGKLNQKWLGIGKRLRGKDEGENVQISERAQDVDCKKEGPNNLHSPPILGPAFSESEASAGQQHDIDDETMMVLNKVNARRVVHSEYGTNNLETEVLEGFVVRLKRGKLGLAMADAGEV